MLDAAVENLARAKFYSFYKNASIPIESIASREFGFGDFENKINKRHIAFKTYKDFKDYLMLNVPAFISISTAFYKDPAARPMENKGWLGSELVFDLDATDLNLECQLKHGKNWVCSNCLEEIKKQTIRLIEDFLISDFGIQKHDISINFSGNRGYHVHVKDKRLFGLNDEARKQITDYITGTGIDLNEFFPNLGMRGEILRGPTPSTPGWGGKLARGVISALNEGEEKLVRLNIDKPIARKLAKNKSDIIFGITTGNWDKVNIPKKADFWRNVLSSMTIAQTSIIDKNVTNSIHHLIRTANTIHGDTGLLAKEVGGLSDLERFDPMKESIIFDEGEIKIHVLSAPEFTIGGRSYGPFVNQDVELPTYASLYLLLKRVAVLPH
ncbi:MAG: DNA primase catalytic subunit PriS [Candidatus Micrarchaeaceae archaeon]